MTLLNPAQLVRIDFSLLVLFSAVLEQRHVGRAAHALNLTPSAVSHGLRRLRRLLHDPLFIKTPSGVAPTERALALAGPVTEIIVRVESVVVAAGPFNPATEKRSFTIGAPDAISTIFLTALVNHVAREAPGIDIRLLQLMPQHHGRPTSQAWHTALADLDARSLDIAVLPIGPLPPRFIERVLFEEDFVVVMRKGHPISRKPFTLKSYLAARHMLVSAIGDATGVVDRMLADRGLSRRVAVTVPNFMMALAQLADSDLIATLPRHLVACHAARFSLTTFSVPLPWKLDTVRVIASQAAMADAGIAWMFELMMRCLANSSTPPSATASQRRRR